MPFKQVTHPITHQVGRAEHDRLLTVWTFRQVVVPNAMLQHESEQHILHRLESLADLIKHDDHGLASMKLESGIGCELGDTHWPRIVNTVINCLGVGQSEVTQVEQRAVDIRKLIVGVPTGKQRTHCRLADPRLTLTNDGHVAAHRVNGLCELVEGNA